MMVRSRVRCFQSLPAPSPAIEADQYHCKPVPSRNGDMGYLTKGILVPGGLVCARGDDRIVTVRRSRGGELQTELQTNHAAQHDIGHHESGSPDEKWQTR